MFTPEFNHASRKNNQKLNSPSTNDFELKRVNLGKENISSNQKKPAAFDYEFTTSDESVAVNKKQRRMSTETDKHSQNNEKKKGTFMYKGSVNMMFLKQI